MSPTIKTPKIRTDFIPDVDPRVLTNIFSNIKGKFKCLDSNPSRNHGTRLPLEVGDAQQEKCAEIVQALQDTVDLPPAS